MISHWLQVPFGAFPAALFCNSGLFGLAFLQVVSFWVALALRMQDQAPYKSLGAQQSD
jgi:hypothetical protein